MNEIVESIRAKHENIISRLSTFNTMELRELYKLRSELLDLIKRVQSLRKTTSAALSRKDTKFINKLFQEMNQIEIQVSSLIFDKEKSQTLRAFWESEVIPEVSSAKATPKFPALADFDVPNLFALMDDTWLPKKRPDDVAPLNLGVAS